MFKQFYKTPYSSHLCACSYARSVTIYFFESFTDTQIECMVFRPGFETADIPVTVDVWNVGKSSAENSVTWTFLKEVTEIENTIGSFFGGQTMILRGSGFQQILSDNHVIIGGNLRCDATYVSSDSKELHCSTSTFLGLKSWK